MDKMLDMEENYSTYICQHLNFINRTAPTFKTEIN